MICWPQLHAWWLSQTTTPWVRKEVKQTAPQCGVVLFACLLAWVWGGPHLVVLRAYSWLFCSGITLSQEGSGNHMGYQELNHLYQMGYRSAPCKANTLPTVLSQPQLCSLESPVRKN